MVDIVRVVFDAAHRHRPSFSPARLSKAERQRLLRPQQLHSQSRIRSLYFENRIYWSYVEAYLGYDSYRGYGVVSANFLHGGAGSGGIKPLQNLSLEINIEGGKFAAGQPRDSTTAPSRRESYCGSEALTVPLARFLNRDHRQSAALKDG